jgi:hypothetical protein
MGFRNPLETVLYLEKSFVHLIGFHKPVHASRNLFMTARAAFSKIGSIRLGLNRSILHFFCKIYPNLQNTSTLKIQVVI